MTITTRRLIEDHTRIRAAGDALATAVDCTTPLPEDHLQELRWALARESLQHLGLDERYVHIPLEQNADPTVCAQPPSKTFTVIAASFEPPAFQAINGLATLHFA